MNYHDDDVPERFFITHEAWFNISISENKFSLPIKSERIVIGLFGDICPMTVTNFITITKGLRRASVSRNSSSSSSFTMIVSLESLDEICLQGLTDSPHRA